MWGEVRREEGGHEKSGVQETTGMCRMAGGWPGKRTEKMWDCGRVNEQHFMGRLKRKEAHSYELVLARWSSW